MTRNEKQMWRAAYHEAGHAVLTVVLFQTRFKLKKASIRPEGEVMGFVSHHRCPIFQPDCEMTASNSQAIRDHIVVLLAGHAAERRFTGRRNNYGASEDVYQAVNLGWYECQDPLQNKWFIRWLTVRAEQMVDHFWEKIEAVAKVLVEKKELTRREIQRIVYPQVEFAPEVLNSFVASVPYEKSPARISDGPRRKSSKRS